MVNGPMVNNMMLKSLLTWLLALVLIAGSLLFFESDFLWKTQELNLLLILHLFKLKI